LLDNILWQIIYNCLNILRETMAVHIDRIRILKMTVVAEVACPEEYPWIRSSHDSNHRDEVVAAVVEARDPQVSYTDDDVDSRFFHDHTSRHYESRSAASVAVGATVHLDHNHDLDKVVVASELLDHRDHNDYCFRLNCLNIDYHVWVRRHFLNATAMTAGNHLCASLVVEVVAWDHDQTNGGERSDYGDRMPTTDVYVLHHSRFFYRFYGVTTVHLCSFLSSIFLLVCVHLSTTCR